MNNSPICPLGAGYVLDIETSDEFNGTGLDGGKWFDYAPDWRGRKEFLYEHRNVAVKGGFLELTAQAIAAEAMSYEDRCNGVLPYTMPIVKSKRKVTYGYFECRSRGATAEVRDAFWLYDPLSGDPARKHSPGSHSEEIDIYEFIGKFRSPDMPYRVCAHVHRFETPYVEGVVNGQKTFLPDEGGMCPVAWAPCDDYHVYGLLWAKDELVWYVDNKPYHRRGNDYFHTPLHVLFNCELATWGGARVDCFDRTTLPAVHSVDYFRRWIQR